MHECVGVAHTTHTRMAATARGHRVGPNANVRRSLRTVREKRAGGSYFGHLQWPQKSSSTAQLLNGTSEPKRGFVDAMTAMWLCALLCSVCSRRACQALFLFSGHDSANTVPQQRLADR